MKTNLLSTLILVSCLTMFSCGGDQISHEGTSSQVELNEGKKWQANPETTDGINKMTVLVQQFEPTENVADYQALSEQLNLAFKEIFEKCSMTGPAHDQLHNYLLPMLGIMKKMRSDDLELCKASVQRMDDRLQEYEEYFK